MFSRCYDIYQFKRSRLAIVREMDKNEVQREKKFCCVRVYYVLILCRRTRVKHARRLHTGATGLVQSKTCISAYTIITRVFTSQNYDTNGVPAAWKAYITNV